MDSQRKLVEPETELEKLCCSIWSKLLNTQIGITDDIFEYGADSLLAIKFKTEMLANNINIPYSNIFKYSKMVDFCQNCNFNKQTTVTSYNYSAINSLLEINLFLNIKFEAFFLALPELFSSFITTLVDFKYSVIFSIDEILFFSCSCCSSEIRPTL